MKYLCLHGFLGGGKDFSFLNDEYSVYAPDLDPLITLDLEEIQAEVVKQCEPGKTTILGYSFGARLGIGLFLNNPSFYKNIILLGGHCGLNSKEEIKKRVVFEELIINKLQSLTLEDFIDEWNQYDLFYGDPDLIFQNQNKEKAAIYFKKWGLSKQAYYLDRLLDFRDKVQWHYGELDIKYCRYSRENLHLFDVCYHKKVGHRILKHPDLVKEILRRSL